MESITETSQQTTSSRRSALWMGGAALAGLALAGRAEAQAAATVTDNDLLNFALNLEYLEAQYYSLAVNGTPIDASLTTGVTSLPDAAATTGAGGTVVYKSTSPKVNFTTPQLAAYAAEVANDELNHVKFLRTQLGAAAVAQPNIDLLNSFNALAQLIPSLGGSFDPFASETNFLLGSFIFEDVGVSAYLGAAPLIQSTAILTAALGIHAVEAYHAGSVRTQIYQTGGTAGQIAPSQAALVSQAIASARASLDGTGPANPDDLGVGTVTTAAGTAATIVDAPPTTARVVPRTPAQVLAIVYGGGAVGQGGGFFPNGVNASNATLR